MLSSPPMETRHVRLRPLTAGDHAWMHPVVSDRDLVVAWRSRGATVSPETFVRNLWQGVLAQFIVEANAAHRPAGLVSAYNADLHGGTAFFAVTAFPPFLNTGLAIEGSLLFLNYLFSIWRLRKIYVETSEDALSSFKSGLQVMHEEGRLVAHEYINGEYID